MTLMVFKYQILRTILSERNSIQACPHRTVTPKDRGEWAKLRILQLEVTLFRGWIAQSDNIHRRSLFLRMAINFCARPLQCLCNWLMVVMLQGHGTLGWWHMFTFITAEGTQSAMSRDWLSLFIWHQHLRTTRRLTEAVVIGAIAFSIKLSPC